ncbi:MAG: TIM barrel protein [Phycisphaerales bacterium]|nr:TIM barrel protein [Phycisphaerales bacterium]
MRRRDFIQMAACAGAAAGISASARAADGKSGKFALPYAPHFGMFREHAGDDPVAQLEFMASEGFTAFEDNGMAGRPVEEQQRIAKAMERLGLRMGVFVANFGTAFGKKSFSRRDPAMLESFLSDLRNAIEVAKRVNAKWMTIVLGDIDPRQEMGFQTANAIEMLRRGAEIFEPHDLVMVMEPLNPWRDHPGMFLSKIPQAYELCKAVDSPAVKILFDIYHQQVTEGNLIPNIDAAWDEIGYFQIGDNPGRNEPTTGEVNYRNIFAHLKRKRYTGILGMEHGNSRPGREGERAVIDAYRWCDESA